MKIIYTMIALAVGAAGSYGHSVEELDEYNKKVEKEEWEDLYVSKERKATKIKTNSEQGKAIMKPFQKVLVKDAKPNSQLIGGITLYKNWALFTGYIADKDGKAYTPKEGIASDTTILFLHTRSGWTVVDYGLGHSDVFYIIWPAQYGAPSELIVGPEKKEK